MEDVHTKRMLFVLAIMVFTLATITVHQVSQDDPQPAAVLRAYAE